MFEQFDTLKAVLRPREQIQAETRATDAVVVVTDERVLVAIERRLHLDIGFGDLRRVEFDIERGQSATLVIVPEQPSNEAQVLTIPPQEIASAARALAILGERLAQ